MKYNLKELAKKHNKWVLMASNLGAGDFAEDIVQESYLKISKMGNNKINDIYMYYTIRSVFIDFIRQKNKIKKIQIEKFYKNDGFKQILDKDLDKFTSNNSTDKEQAFWKLCSKMDKELENWHFYEQGIYKIYRDTDLSIRGMAKDTKISFVNIFHTLKKTKKIMKDKFGEDYQDYLNEDYDLI